MKRQPAGVPHGVRPENETSKRWVGPRLQEDEIHVWRASLDDAGHERNRSLLSSDEILRAGRYRFARDQARFVAGRAALRIILAGYLDDEPADLKFRHGPHGKPYLANNSWAEPLYFNVSHADSVALYAVARGGEVGIDIERIREIPDWSGIARTFFDRDEHARLALLTAERRNLAFLQAWTRREALLKLSGEGLTGENDGRGFVQGNNVTVYSITPAPGYLAALASRFPAPRVIFMKGWNAPESTPAGSI